MEHKNLALVGNNQDSPDGLNLSDRDIESVNNSLLSYSRKWNKEFTKLNHAGDALVKNANLLNAQTSDFNRFIGIMYHQLEDVIDFLKAGQ